MDLGVRIFSSAAAESAIWLRIARLEARIALEMENQNVTAVLLDPALNDRVRRPMADAKRIEDRFGSFATDPFSVRASRCPLLSQ